MLEANGVSYDDFILRHKSSMQLEEWESYLTSLSKVRYEELITKLLETKKITEKFVKKITWHKLHKVTSKDKEGKSDGLSRAGQKRKSNDISVSDGSMLV